MRLVRPSAIVRWIALLVPLMTLAAGAALAQTFTDAPISCGSGSPYKACTASFDGRFLRITHTHPEGKHSVATYRKCNAMPTEIQCSEGEWSSDSGKGRVGARSMGLRDGLPYRN